MEGSHLSTPPPSPNAPLESTRTQRIEARVLKRAGKKYREIAPFLGLTIRQVGIACRDLRATPRRRSGRPPVLTASQLDELIEFISASKENRRLPFWRLAIVFEWEGVSVGAIRSALARAGYKVSLSI